MPPASPQFAKLPEVRRDASRHRTAHDDEPKPLLLIMFAVLAMVAVALGFYAVHLKRKVARDEQAAIDQQVGSDAAR